MRVNTQLCLIGALIAAALIVAGLAWKQADGERATATIVTAPASATPPAAPRPAPMLPAVPAAVLAMSADVPLSDHVQRLLATHDPHDAHTAYLLVASCARFNDTHDLELYDHAQRSQRRMNADERRHLTAMCGKMTERERLARLDYLATAVKGGVAGAAWTFAVEGPFGDPSALQTRPDDPLVREWKATAAAQLEQAAEAGDASTLLVWGMVSLQGPGMLDADPTRGYGYLLAFGLIDADRHGANSPSAQQYASGSDIMNAFGGALTPQQRAAALALAQRIAARVKAKRQQSADSQGLRPSAGPI